MDLQSLFSDNQLAVIGCFAALAVCGGIAALSFQFGSAGRHSTSDDRSTIHPLTRPARSEDDQQTRRAA